MGQATILSHLGGGLYRVKLLFANGIVTARIAAIGLQITALDAQITELEGQKNAAYTDLQTALDSMNDYLGSVTPEQLATDPTAINALTKEAFTARAHYDTLAMRWRMAKSKKTALETNRSYLQNYCPSDITVDAWSVSFNEDLTGNAATIEVDYVLQRNSGTGQAVVNDSGVWLFPGAQFDSRLQHPLASSEHATWFNLCMLPAMQRDRPRYRVATLSNLNKSTNACTVAFDGSESIDPDGLLPNRPIYPHGSQSTNAVIVYPPCNGKAFKNGDRVIVAAGNVVIGFYSNPKRCPISFTILFQTNTSIERIGSESLVYTFTGTSEIEQGYVGSGVFMHFDEYSAVREFNYIQNSVLSNLTYPIIKNGDQVGSIEHNVTLTHNSVETSDHNSLNATVNISTNIDVEILLTIDSQLSINIPLGYTANVVGHKSGNVTSDYVSTSVLETIDGIFVSSSGAILVNVRNISSIYDYNIDNLVRQTEIHKTITYSNTGTITDTDITSTTNSTSSANPFFIQGGGDIWTSPYESPSPPIGFNDTNRPMNNSGINYRPVNSGGIINI